MIFPVAVEWAIEVEEIFQQPTVGERLAAQVDQEPLVPLTLQTAVLRIDIRIAEHDVAFPAAAIE